MRTIAEICEFGFVHGYPFLLLRRSSEGLYRSVKQATRKIIRKKRDYQRTIRYGKKLFQRKKIFEKIRQIGKWFL